MEKHGTEQGSKFVVRNLPPSMPEEAFRCMLHNVLKDELEWFRYQQGEERCAGLV
jgi:Smg-4/UPF3 family